MTPQEVLARDIAEWIQDGKDVDEEAMIDAHTLLAFLQRKGWRFTVPLGRADYTGRVPK